MRTECFPAPIAAEKVFASRQETEEERNTVKWVIYYVVTLGLNLFGALVFRERLNLEYHSLIPLFLIGLSIFQIAYFSRHPTKREYHSNNASDLTDAEWEQMMRYSVRSYLVFIPFLIPFVCFFSHWGKLLSIPVFFAAFVGGAVAYRIRHQKEYQARFAKEDRELEAQKKREELGKWK